MLLCCILPGLSLPKTISFQFHHFHRGTIEVVNPNSDPNAESGGGPFARGRAPASAMGVWRTPKNEEYANPEALVGRKVRVYFDGDCTYFEAQVIFVVQCCRLSFTDLGVFGVRSLVVRLPSSGDIASPQL